MDQQGTPVVVTTEHRGVFFGYLDGSKDDPTVELRQAQMCVYWDTATRGVMGLASGGPSKGCRVTAPVPSVTLHKVTAVMDVTDGAVKAWLACPWS